MTNDMTSGNPVKLIIRFMIPMCLGNIFQQFYFWELMPWLPLEVQAL